MKEREVILEIGDLNFNCKHIVENDGQLRFKKDAPCRLCRNSTKCKLYVTDHNRRLLRVKAIRRINRIKELDTVIVDIYKTEGTELQTYLGLSFLFEDHKREKQSEKIYLSAKWVRFGRQYKKRIIDKKLMAKITAGGIPKLTIETAKEQLKKRIENEENIPSLSLSIDN